MITCSDCPYKLICLLTAGESIEYYAKRFACEDRKSYEDCLYLVKQIFELGGARFVCLYIEKNIKERWPLVEHIVLESIHEVVIYSIQVVKGRWREGEKVLLDSISKNLYFALSPVLSYIDHVVKERWIEAEVFIERDYFYYQTYRAKYIDKNEDKYTTPLHQQVTYYGATSTNASD